MKLLNRNKAWIILAGILLLGFILRYHNVYTWPRHGATFDEFAWTWQGINLIQTGTPISWSPHSFYTDYELIKYQGADFRLVTPFLEHPPVFGIVAGGFALMNGAGDMFDVALQMIRPLALILGVLSIVMVFLLVKELYGKRIGLIASGLYGIIPTVVVGSRIVQNENFFIPLWLLSLWLVVLYMKGKRAIFRNLAVVICVLLVLSKVPWIAAPGSIVLIFLFTKRYKDALMFMAASIVALVLFFLYGFYYDSNLFFSLWGLQAARYDITFSSMFALFHKPYLVDRFFLDGWIYFGWVAFILLCLDLKKHYVVVFALLAYFTIYILGIPDEPGHGWYRYPFYPFLIIAIGIFIREHFNKNYLLTFLFLIITGLSLFELTWSQAFGFSFIVFRGFIFLSALTLLPLFFKKTGKAITATNYSLLGFILCMSVWAILLYNEQ